MNITMNFHGGSATSTVGTLSVTADSAAGHVDDPAQALPAGAPAAELVAALQAAFGDAAATPEPRTGLDAGSAALTS